MTEGSFEAGAETVAVVGLGLMGGSLCRALRSLEGGPRLLGIDPDVLQGARALEAGVVDRFDPEAGALIGEADIVVYATPLGAASALLREHPPLWKDGAFITDVVSLKAPLLRAAARGGFAQRYVGAHPMCGSEASGFGAARAELFQGATVWLCAEGVSSAGASAAGGAETRGQGRAQAPPRERAEAFWRSVGGIPRWIDAEEHDRRMAWVSHLPQLVANALAGALDAAGYSPSELGPGARDMTRLAGSNPALWKELLEISAPVTGAGLTSVSDALNVLADLLARREVERVAEFMERTRHWREEDR